MAIDGPAGAGKSTVARDVAGRLGFVYVDTGAMYRAAALYGIENGYNLDDLGDIEKFIGAVKLRLERGEDGGQRVLLDGRDVTGRLREAAVAEGSSKVAVCRRVREAMVLLQREAAARNNVVMDGRDIGTVVLPCADLKIYLRASAETRARRRFDEEREKGGAPVFDRILEDIRERDLRDSAREHSPLRQAEGAVVLDTDGLSREEAAERVIELWNARGN
ncbi:MAG: (d)CMP kinase [Clostridiales bacterium]|nr:(d)CMP kinase [Clostridiales bacterium]